MNSTTWNTLKARLEDTVKRELGLSGNAKIDIKRTRPAVGGGGAITIHFTPTIGGTPTIAKSVTVDHDDDSAFLLAALKDAAAKNQYPYISIAWFKNTWLPALGAKFTFDELNALITRLTASGEVIVEKVHNPNGKFPTTTIRTPDMPVWNGE